MVDRNHLSQDDINALIAGGSIDRSEDEEEEEDKNDSTLIVDPNAPTVEGPLSKVINVTGMNINELAGVKDGDSVEEDAPAAEIEVADDPPGPPPPPAPEVPEPAPVTHEGADTTN